MFQNRHVPTTKVYPSVCMSVCVCAACVILCVSMCVFVCVLMEVYIYIYIYIYIYMHLCVCVCAYQFVGVVYGVCVSFSYDLMCIMVSEVLFEMMTVWIYVRESVVIRTVRLYLCACWSRISLFGVRLR